MTELANDDGFKDKKPDDDEEDRLPNVISEGEISGRLDKNDDNPSSSMPPSENFSTPELLDDPNEPENLLDNDDVHHEEDPPAKGDGDILKFII